MDELVPAPEALPTHETETEEIYGQFLKVFKASLQIAEQVLSGQLVENEYRDLIREIPRYNGGKKHNHMTAAIKRAELKTRVAMQILSKAPSLEKKTSESPVTLNFNVPRPTDKKTLKVVEAASEVL